MSKLPPFRPARDPFIFGHAIACGPRPKRRHQCPPSCFGRPLRSVRPTTRILLAHRLTHGSRCERADGAPCDSRTWCGARREVRGRTNRRRLVNRNNEGCPMKLRVNGQDQVLEGIDPTMPLLWAIRDLLGLKGTKFGCGRALCGACTVHMDGQAVRSCQISLADVGDSKVTTIEAVA